MKSGVYWCVGKKGFWAAVCCGALLLVGTATASGAVTEKKWIQWVDFTPSYGAMEKALETDIASHKEEGQGVGWVDLLAYLGAKYGGDFSRYKESHLTQAAKAVREGGTLRELLGEGGKYYDYYLEAYSAVLEGFVGNYLTEKQDPKNPEKTVLAGGYGLKAFGPIAKGYGYSHYADFGDGRAYGYRRKHLGNDLLAPVGTPVVAVEGGRVEAAGWNQYGGWRIGIRTGDQKRYYYYAHLRKGRPFAQGIKEGSQVEAGQVIGYVGMTGYSTKEDVNGMTTPHLHFGLQLIFDESQKEGNGEIWVDVYQLVKLLDKNRSAVIRDDATKEYHRKYRFTPLE